MRVDMVRKLICTLLCLVTLAGCSNKEKPKQYVAELSHPYINSLPSAFNKDWILVTNSRIHYQKKVIFPTIDFLHLSVYKGNVMIGYEIVTAKNTDDYLKRW